MSRLRIILIAVLALFAGAACTTTPVVDEGTPEDPPSWVEDVIPEPGAVATVPDAVEVDHNLTATDEDVRLIVDGVDVTTYAEFDAGKLRYESGAGPVVLGTGDHTAEVQRVLLPADETDYQVLDTYIWEFRVG